LDQRGTETVVQKESALSTPVSPNAPAASESATKPKPELSVSAGDEIIEMDRMRKLIADHMVMSKRTSAHVTSFVEADVTNIVAWRNKIKDEFRSREGENFTFTPIFIDALVRAIKDFPMINISVDGDRIIKKKNINIGMAAALPSGNLIVPVIQNADFMNLTGLAKTVNDLAGRARENKLKPEEIQGGTYTITNVGTFGNLLGTPIINQPQVAIMATGAIRKVPAVMETEFGDVIAIRHKMFLSHSYDHRVVDGALGGMFVKRVADYLEQWDMNREL
jgi:2-oxoglutarate dehydrogenase E2 component (dihydrolipoamide succinyltransferase)